MDKLRGLAIGLLAAVLVVGSSLVWRAQENTAGSMRLVKMDVPGVASIGLQRGGEFVALRLSPGADPMMALDELAKQQKWAAASVVSVVGSLSKAAIRFANVEGTEVLAGSFEIIGLSGTVSSNGSHLHISIADSLGRMTGGHLMTGSRVRTTCELVLAVLPDMRFTREPDSLSGYNELVVRWK